MPEPYTVEGLLFEVLTPLGFWVHVTRRYWQLIVGWFTNRLTLFLVIPGPAVPTAIGPLGQRKTTGYHYEVALRRLSSNRRRPVL